MKCIITNIIRENKMWIVGMRKLFGLYIYLYNKYEKRKIFEFGAERKKSCVLCEKGRSEIYPLQYTPELPSIQSTISVFHCSRWCCSCPGAESMSQIQSFFLTFPSSWLGLLRTIFDLTLHQKRSTFLLVFTCSLELCYSWRLGGLSLYWLMLCFHT